MPALLLFAGIVAYLAMRFEWKFGVAGIIANLHDVVIITVLCILSGNFPYSTGRSPCDLGYSVNRIGRYF